MKRACGIVLVLAFVAALLLPTVNVASAQQAPKGPWVDEVVFLVEEEEAKVYNRLIAGDIHAYFTDLSDPTVIDLVKKSPQLWYATAYGLFFELTINPVGPEFPKTGKMNPFSSAKVREALNWLVDRDYIANEICGGLAVPRYFALTPAFPDYARVIDVARSLEVKYSYNFEKAKEVITAEMLEMGAELRGGKWYYKGEPVELRFLIRVEDQRKAIGDYIASQLEKLGFTVNRMYKTGREASPIWIGGDPANGEWHLYTAGWITTLIARDEGDNFEFYYTPRGYPVPLWQAYKPSPDFDDVCYRLAYRLYSSVEEREQLLAKALQLSMEDSVRVWLVNQKVPYVAAKGLQLTSDLAAGFSGSRLWPYTIRFEGRTGGQVKIAMSNMLVDPWNPVAGTNWVYDTTIIQATCDQPAVPNPFNGLYLPNRVEKATVYVKSGLPVGKTLDWVDLVFVDEPIAVPSDAWYGWNATTRQITNPPAGLKANVKVVVEYDDQLFNVKYHDGTKMSLADVVFNFILDFDRGDPASPLYDESHAVDLEAFKTTFGGFRIVKESPLTIEFYTNATYLDAEWIAFDAITSFYPWGGLNYGAMPWHMIAIGMLAEMDGKLAFSSDKAAKLNIDWLSYIAGPSLDILKEELDKAIANGFIPYQEVLGKYLTKDEALAKYNALKAWFEKHGHFWVGNGPFYLDRVDATANIITLKAFREYPDVADKWLIFSEPKFPAIALSGPSDMIAGEAAYFEARVTYRGSPYPADEIEFVKYIVLDQEGNALLKGEATPVSDGLYTIVVPTSELVPGTYRLEAIALSKLVCVPQGGEAYLKVTSVKSFIDSATQKMKAEMDARLSGIEASMAEQQKTLQDLRSSVSTLTTLSYASVAVAIVALIVAAASMLAGRKKA
ncbi:MAG: ABC transporter substrate-binding protein [Candidatus Nezhaarchaeota archaeon]|nr:ABC transporter substrate-binding protein [Candidatus Nezhaarchaeota archaeon]